MTFAYEAYGRADFEDEQPVRDKFWKPGDGEVVVDVGAAIGSYTLPALAAGARVLALCPQADHRKLLVENLGRNSGFAERCTVLDVGAHESWGWMKLNGSRDRYERALTWPGPGDPETFLVGPIDGLRLERVDWIKIDVEGHEEAVLRGAEDTIRRCRPKLLVENHVFMDSQIEKRVSDFVIGLRLGYEGQAHPWNSVSHTFFEVRA